MPAVRGARAAPVRCIGRQERRITMSSSSSLLDRYLDEGFLHVEGVFAGEEVERVIGLVAHLPEWGRSQRADRNLQRIQPLQSCKALKDRSWIKTFYDNPRLDHCLDSLFREHIVPAPRMSRDRQITGLLIEPLDCWWSTGLHRDYRDFLPHLDLDAWRARTGDLRLFNQINIPLLADSNFWLIPGSHAREDHEQEARLVRLRARYDASRTRSMPSEEVDAHRRELMEGLRRCDAINVKTRPGDLVLYRSNMLHCGVYEPGTRRLTLHDAVYSSKWHRYVVETFA